MKFSIILPVFNQPGYTEKCIRDLYATKASFELLVVDNGSLFETKKLLKSLQQLYSFKILELDKNKRWAQAINLGLKSLKLNEYVILLQNDCFVFEGFFNQIKREIVSIDSQTKILLPRTNYSRSKQLLVLEIANEFEKIKHSNKGFPKTYDWVSYFLKQLYSTFDSNKLREQKRTTYCSVLDSYCLIIESSIFDEGFFFNESFKTLGWVEKEWYHRLSKVGYEAWILNHINVHHHGNLTTDGNGRDYGKALRKDEDLYKELTNVY
jgi:GT2 family glycosyltransferase